MQTCRTFQELRDGQLANESNKKNDPKYLYIKVDIFLTICIMHLIPVKNRKYSRRRRKENGHFKSKFDSDLLINNSRFRKDEHLFVKLVIESGSFHNRNPLNEPKGKCKKFRIAILCLPKLAKSS